MSNLIHCIPLSALREQSYRQVIVRAADPTALVAALAAEDPQRIFAAQLLSLDNDSEALNAWGSGLPIELILNDPDDFPSLYRHVNLLEAHPLRVNITAVAGFSKAVKVALALHFAVHLDLGQPEPAVCAELAEVLKLYLHHSTIAQPIDYFQVILMGLYHQQPQPLWITLDEDPSALRWVNEDGTESLYGRLAAIPVAQVPDGDCAVWIEQVLAADAQCQSCEFRQSCGGYFKWPRRDYDCAGVQRLFGLVSAAAEELRNDMAAGPL